MRSRPPIRPDRADTATGPSHSGRLVFATMSRAGTGVGRAAALLTVLATASAVLGFGRDVVIAAVFGAGAELDAFLVAQGMMNLVLGLVSSAVATALVPVIAREAAGDDGVRRANHTVTVALSVTLVVLGLASAVLWLFAGSAVSALAPGFDGQQADLAVRTTRIILVAVVLVSGTNLLAAAAQARRRFFWAGVQGIPFNLTMIVAAVGFGPTYGITALAVGFVIGSALRLACQLVPLRAIGLRLRFSFDLTDPGVRAIARLTPALLVGSGVGNVNTLVDRAVASVVGEGVITSLSYGWRLVTLPETLVIASLVAALYPAFGASATRRSELRRLVGRGLSSATMVVMPICALLLVAAHPLVRLAFGHGSFDADAVEDTATAVRWYVPALFAMGWRDVVVKASYALGDSRAPVLVAVAAMCVNVVGDLTVGLSYGVPGLAASTSAAICLAAVANTWLLARRHRGVWMRPLAGLVGRTTMAAGAATLAGGVVVHAIDLRLGESPGTALAQVTLAALAVWAVFLLVLRVLRGPEMEVLRDAIALIRRQRG